MDWLKLNSFFSKRFLKRTYYFSYVLFSYVLFSFSNANNGFDGLRDGITVKRRSMPNFESRGGYNILIRPYVLNFVNFKAMAKLKKLDAFRTCTTSLVLHNDES